MAADASDSDSPPSLTPDEAFGLAVRRLEIGNPAGALAICNQLADLMPDRPELWQVAGLSAFALGGFGEAASHFEQAVALEPENPAHRINLANALIKLGRDRNAEDVLKKAIALAPDSAEAWIALGTLARRGGDLDAAIANADRAIAIRPDAYQARVNKGRALHELGRFSDALDAYAQAVAIDPAAAPAHAARALTHLLTGDFTTGWTEYEWRGEGTDVVGRARFAQPEWAGEDLSGGTLLVHAEQGFGDTIQFVRFLPMVAARCTHVVAEVQPALKRLLTRFAPSIEIVGKGEVLPPFDRHIRLMSLPRVLGIGMPERLAFPYLHATMPSPLPNADERLTVGLCWAGNATHENDGNRSIPADLLAPVGAIPGIRFVSVQKGQGAAVSLPPFPVLDAGPALNDFADLANVLDRIDLLISVDSAPAHLMGALGKPVWILLPDPPDWRWLLERTDTPWYPTARLFRQHGREGWSPVVERVKMALIQLVEETRDAANRVDSSG